VPEHPAADTTSPAELLPPATLLCALTKLVEDLAGRLAAPPAELLTREQVAAMLNVSLRTFTELESAGAVGPEPVRLGGSGRLIRYQADRIRAWVAAGAPGRQRWLAIEAAKPRKAG
jgi:predicted DNA-binding transcriptional regulator AlpA